ncbi:hypothetical protein [Pedobacter sp. B4-66]|uniref:hypothetical protein n=1 Tax=Pedobacter sp. B4-66 TaxID=2817280 RepID=UPI001BD93826|nr:hypothetical protein [Pedobacter sp. B4-66]
MYFKTIPIPLDLNQPQAEASLRKASIKESMTLDFKFKAVDIGADKLFYGLEGKRDLKLFLEINITLHKINKAFSKP